MENFTFVYWLSTLQNGFHISVAKDFNGFEIWEHIKEQLNEIAITSFRKVATIHFLDDIVDCDLTEEARNEFNRKANKIL